MARWEPGYGAPSTGVLHTGQRVLGASSRNHMAGPSELGTGDQAVENGSGVGYRAPLMGAGPGHRGTFMRE